MRSIQHIFLATGIFLLLGNASHAKGSEQPLYVISPNGIYEFVVIPSEETADIIQFSVIQRGETVIKPSTLGLLAKEMNFSGPFSVEKVERRSVDQEWTTSFGERSVIPDQYNEMTVHLKGGTVLINLIVRTYNEGVAFAYEIPEQSGIKQLRIDDELVSYRFAQDHKVWSTPPRMRNKLTAQGRYRKIPLTQLEAGAERPLVVECGEGRIIALAEAALVDYARISYTSDPEMPLAILSSLDGRMSNAKQNKVSGAMHGGRSASAKASVKLPFRSPWRVIMMAESPGELLENNYLILNLNEPNAIKDTSWIMPGKVLRETTLTTEGGLRAIDFVAANGMQYVHFDAGWYGHEMDESSDATTITLDPKRSKGPFDIEKIMTHAKERGVRVMLYVNRRALEKQLDELLPLYQEWGISGIKFGFVRVGDQDATAWMHEAIRKAAAHKMVVNVHDEYRPTGYSRIYPNLLTQEGIRGDEESVSNEHTLITMFTRMLAGAADNTVCYYNSRVDEKMGSHASQLAKTVCLFSPLQFLFWYDRPAESPDKIDGLWGDTKHIGNEPELEFFRQVPTTWDETRVLTAEIAEIGVIARRKETDWYVGGINGPTARDVAVDFSFLEPGVTYQATLYTDDENIKTRTRVKINSQELTAASRITIPLKANNGFAMRLEKQL
ncbi:glycoside hydrolase family 97 N-terminal domain-containing protein [Pontiellaceae bacterium B12227]|nr:glycoside hydrolase family 97 N-terminal domain-containing protein [Pontiellaceae bacterium B12227]